MISYYNYYKIRDILKTFILRLEIPYDYYKVENPLKISIPRSKNLLIRSKNEERYFRFFISQIKPILINPSLWNHPDEQVLVLPTLLSFSCFVFL